MTAQFDVFHVSPIELVAYPPAEVDVTWIEHGLDELRSGNWRIGNMVPAGYSSYLRIMPSAQRVGDNDFEEITWQDGRPTGGGSSSCQRIVTPLSLAATRMRSGSSARIRPSRHGPSSAATQFHGSSVPESLIRR